MEGKRRALLLLCIEPASLLLCWTLLLGTEGKQMAEYEGFEGGFTPQVAAAPPQE